MQLYRRTVLIGLLLWFSLAGCYITPVRHLASDIGLIKVGESTKEDVVVYLGEPDEQRDLGEGRQQWLYVDIDKTFLEKTPMIGKHLGSPEVKKVIVTFDKDRVTDAVYTSSDEDDMDWSRDYSWQQKEE